MIRYSFNSLKYNKCQISLDSIEKIFFENNINKSIEEDKLNLIAIKNLVEVFFKNSNIRYFSFEQIPMIAENLYNDIRDRILSEEVGRNWHSKESSPIQQIDIFNKNNENSLSQSIDTVSGKSILRSKNGEIDISFDTDAELKLYLQSLVVKINNVLIMFL